MSFELTVVVVVSLVGSRVRDPRVLSPLLLQSTFQRSNPCLFLTSLSRAVSSVQCVGKSHKTEEKYKNFIHTVSFRQCVHWSMNEHLYIHKGTLCNV